ncbi:MAG: 50S ribosomal protein L7/L12 [Clostridia bacterium]|nr:50S ribosomal protein L7/L12 [Clostridia bacterium]MBQ8750002.1 50S ribosomal protein L7/L12 [Clostridia bacterium]
MADLNKIVDLISECSVVEVSELVKMLEEKFGVSAAAPVMVAGPAQGGAEEAAKTEFNVVLKDAGASKINVIKIVKDLTGLGLVEAKGMVENLPATIKEGVAKAEAEEMADKLKAAGAIVELQ